MDLEQVSEMAKQVAHEHDALEQAKEDKAIAEDELLKLVVDTIKPALPAMCSKVEGGAGPIARAVFVDGWKDGPGLYLGEQGDWFEMRSDKPHVLSVAEVLADYDLALVVVTLVQKLREQVGARDKSTRQINDEIARLRALATLLAPPVVR